VIGIRLSWPYRSLHKSHDFRRLYVRNRTDKGL